jgi:transcriptional regulator with XRE-family HTH domain
MKLHGALDNYIEMHREQYGLSQAELSLLISVEQRSSLSQIERGARHPSLRTLLALEMVFGHGIQDLFAGVAEEVRQHVTSRSRELLESLGDAPNAELLAKVELLSKLAHPDEHRVIPEWRSE